MGPPFGLNRGQTVPYFQLACPMEGPSQEEKLDWDCVQER